MVRSARFSENGAHRLELGRDWTAAGETPRTVNFIMLNPSTADGVRDDATIRKCIGFARRWGFTAIAVTNLIPIVSTDPWRLPRFNGIDRDNAAAVSRWMRESDKTVVAWGDPPAGIKRLVAFSEHLYHLFALAPGKVLYCIDTTVKGKPLHPSRAAYTHAPVVWRQL
jgi:hypothetical protein